MLSHALTIIANELTRQLDALYGVGSITVGLGNLAEGVGSATGAVPRNQLCLSVINTREERALKNLPNYVRNDSTLTATYENPPVFLNFFVLVTATHSVYADALLILSRAIRFFQLTNVFTQDSVAPLSLTSNAPTNPLDQLESFKLIFDLYSPSMEEINYMWGTLGGKQYPFALYLMRLLDLRFRGIQQERGLITEVTTTFSQKTSVTN